MEMTWLDHVEINIQGKNDGQKEACGLQVAKNEERFGIDRMKEDMIELSKWFMGNSIN